MVAVDVPVPTATGSSEYSVRARHTWELRVRGERQTVEAEVRDAILEYMAHQGFAGSWSQQKEVVMAAVLMGAACRENHWQQFCFSWGYAPCQPGGSPCNHGDFKPPISYDGGYGLFQLTVPPPNVTEVWDWVRNLAEAERRFEGLYSDATSFFAGHPGAPPTDDMLFRETLSRFNGGTYYRWDRTTSAWVPNLPAGCSCRGRSSNDLLCPGLPPKPSGYCYVNRTDCVP